MFNKIVSLASFLLLANPAAATAFWSGSLDASDPRFNRPASLSGLSFGGTSVAYDVQAFRVNAPGDYVFESGQDYDGFILVYAGAFSPATPLLNLLGGGDDFTPDPFSSDPADLNQLLNPWTYAYGSKLDTPTNGFGALTLAPGIRYLAVTTSFDDATFGHYANALGGGPGTVTLEAVPEPVPLAALALGLAAYARRRRRA